MSPAVFVPLGLFAMLTISVALVCRLIATASLNKTIREALRSDPGSVPVLAAGLEARQPWADALLGWIFLALAAAIAGLSAFEEGYERREMLQAAVIPVVIGVTILVYVRVAERRAAR
jgi:hypothetical protein